MSRKKTEKAQGARTLRHARVQVINPHAVGIDVGSEVHYVAVPPDRDPDLVRSFNI